MAFAPYADVEQMYDKYADMLYRIALTHSQDCEDAMDAVQDVFVKYFSTGKTFSDEERDVVQNILKNIFVNKNIMYNIHNKDRWRY